MLCTICNGEFDSNGVSFKFCPLCGAEIVPEDTRTHEEKMRFIAEKFEDIYESPMDLCAVIDENFNDEMGRLLKFITTYNASVQVLELKEVAPDKLSEEYDKILARLQYNTFINPEVAKPALDLLCYGLGLEIEYTPKPPKPAPAPVINLDDFVIEKRVLKEYKGNDTVVAIPDCVSYIGDEAFVGYTCLTKVIIPNSVTEIGISAFSGCTSLTEVDIPDSVTTIGEYAFVGCKSLTEITIPDSVTIIGGYAFYRCTSLTEVDIPDSVTTIDWHAFEGCKSLTEINIPESVTTIGGNAFQGCTSLTEINIPESVTEIGVNAFSGCTSLTNITIPESVNNIYYQKHHYDSVKPTCDLHICFSAFEDCTNLSQETKNKLRYLSGNNNIVPS